MVGKKRGGGNNALDFSWSTIEDDEDSKKDCKCRYYEAFSNVFKEHYDFAAFSLNIRSLPGKWDNLLDFLLDLNQGEFKFDIICMQEFGLYLNISRPGYKQIAHKLRNQRDKSSLIYLFKS